MRAASNDTACRRWGQRLCVAGTAGEGLRHTATCHQAYTRVHGHCPDPNRQPLNAPLLQGGGAANDTAAAGGKPSGPGQQARGRKGRAAADADAAARAALARAAAAFHPPGRRYFHSHSKLRCPAAELFGAEDSEDDTDEEEWEVRGGVLPVVGCVAAAGPWQGRGPWVWTDGGTQTPPLLCNFMVRF